MTDVCIVTTCRGRLAHLKQSLPTFARQEGAACIVVDYGCPEGTADWVGEAFAQVTLVRESNRPRFEAARARNLGAAVAKAEWLCFADADNLMAPSFAQVIRPLLRPGGYYRPVPRAHDLDGFCVCRAEDFRRIGGYDEILQGYGWEDLDLVMCLQLAGLEERHFPGALVRALTHDDLLRTSHYEVKDSRVNAAANQLYCNIKWDLARLQGKAMAADSRQALYDKIRTAVTDAHRKGTGLELHVPANTQHTLLKGTLKTILHYQLAPPEKAPAPRAKG